MKRYRVTLASGAWILAAVMTAGAQRAAHPDIRGVWNKVGGGLQEAHPPVTPLNDSETFGDQAEPAGFNNLTTPRITPGKPVAGRRNGVINPADKVLPWRPEQDAKRREFIARMNPPASLDYIEPLARCTPPAPWSNGPLEIVQRDDRILMLFENDHANRTLHLDGRPHLGSAITLFMGDSIGHWEGNTLVVDTTNLNGKGQFARQMPYYSDAMHLVERFTVVGANLIDYEIVFDDPTLFTRPITSAGYLTRDATSYELVENACAEGSHTLRNIFGF